MMGKPNTLEEQEEQKKREAESFFAQKDSGTNREQSEVTPPTPPKKPGFWDWLAGVFGYETQTTKNWKQYTEKLASYQETVRRQEEERAAERAAKEREESEDLEDFLKDEPSAEKQKDGPDLSDVDIKKGIIVEKDGEVIHATIREAEQSGPDLSDVDIKKGIIVEKDGEVIHATIKEAKQSGPDLSDVDLTKSVIGEEDGEVIHATIKEAKQSGPDLWSDVDITKSVHLGKDGEEAIHATAKTTGDQLRDLDQSFSRMAQALNPEAKPVAVGTDSSIPGDLALYCTVVAAQSLPGNVSLSLRGIFNGVNLQHLAHAKTIWEETPQNQRADLLVRGLARLSQMPAEPLGMGKDVIMSGLVIKNVLQNMDGGLKFAVEQKLPIEGKEMVKGAQTLGEIGHRGLMSYTYLQNPRESAQLTPQQRGNMIMYALEYEAASQVLDNHTPVWTGGLPTSTTLQPVLGREGGLQSLRNSVLQAERAAGQNSLFAMDVKTLAETMTSRDNVKRHVPQMQPKAPAQQSHGPQQTRAQVTHQKTPNVMGRV